MATNHSNLIKQILLSCSSKYCRLWKSESGVARSMDGNRVISFGLRGSADITGILKCVSGAGVRVEIEVKVGRDKQREAQKNFEKMILKMGGFYIIGKDLQSVIDSLDCFRLNN